MTVQIDIQDGVGLLTMNDGKVNAIGHAMVDALNQAIDQVEADDAVKAVVLTGMAGKFSAGFDLRFFERSTMEENLALVDAGGRVAYRLFDFAKPVVAAVSGHAIAMGVFLALACDRRIGAAGDFKIGANETANNLVLPRFAKELSQFRLKPHFLDEAVIAATLYGPEKAMEAGYLDRVVAPDALMPTALETAAQLSALPREGYAGNKRLIREEPLARIAASLGLER